MNSDGVGRSSRPQPTPDIIYEIWHSLEVNALILQEDPQCFYLGGRVLRKVDPNDSSLREQRPQVLVPLDGATTFQLHQLPTSFKLLLRFDVVARIGPHKRVIMSDNAEAIATSKTRDVGDALITLRYELIIMLILVEANEGVDALLRKFEPETIQFGLALWIDFCCICSLQYTGRQSYLILLSLPINLTNLFSADYVFAVNTRRSSRTWKVTIGAPAENRPLSSLLKS